MKKIVLFLVFLFFFAIQGSAEIIKRIPVNGAIVFISVNTDSNQIYIASDLGKVYVLNEKFDIIKQVDIAPNAKQILYDNSRIIIAYRNYFISTTPNFKHFRKYKIPGINYISLKGGEILIATDSGVYIRTQDNGNREITPQKAFITSFLDRLPVILFKNDIQIGGEKIDIPYDVEKPFVSLAVSKDVIFAASYGKLYRYDVRNHFWDKIYSLKSPRSAVLIRNLLNDGHFLYCQTYNNFYIYNKIRQTWSSTKELTVSGIFSSALFKNFVIIGANKRIIIFDKKVPSLQLYSLKRISDVYNFVIHIGTTHPLKNIAITYNNYSAATAAVPIKDYNYSDTTNRLSFSLNTLGLYSGQYKFNVAVTDADGNSNNFYYSTEIMSNMKAILIYGEAKYLSNDMYRLSGRLIDRTVNRIILVPGRIKADIDSSAATFSANMPLELGNNAVSAFIYKGDKLVGKEKFNISAFFSRKGLRITGIIANYKIKKGDTLWSISNKYYSNPTYYPLVAAFNGIKKGGYRKIRIGKVLRIPKF